MMIVIMEILVIKLSDKHSSVLTLDFDRHLKDGTQHFLLLNGSFGTTEQLELEFSFSH